MTDAKEEAIVLKHIPYIYYPVQFNKDVYGTQVQALIDSRSGVNTMASAYALKLDLKVHFTNVRTQKIDSSTLKTFGMVLTSLQVKDKLGRARIFQETFLLANISTEIVLRMLFFTSIMQTSSL